MRALVVNFEQEAAKRLRKLTRMQRRVMDEMLDGQPNKIIAYRLGISVRTAENHRAAVMMKTGAESLVDLLRYAILADLENDQLDEDDTPPASH
jgi:two-component system CheB/CheR fusion protein